MTGETHTLDDEVIGLALASQRDLRDLVTAHVKAEHFASPLHADTWRIIQEIDAADQPVDPQTVYAARANVDSLVARQITLPWLMQCLHVAPMGYVGTSRARLLKDAYDRRETTAALIRAQQALDGGVNVRDVRLETMSALQNVTDDDTSLTTLADSIGKVVQGFDQVARYAPTPWRSLNRSIRGWRPGALYVVGARPGIGKSLFLQAAALSLSNHGQVLFEALEMEHEEITIRLLAQVSEVSQGLMGGIREDGKSPLGDAQRARIDQARQRIQDLPLTFARGGSTVERIREHARQLRARGPLAGIVVDYLQLMRTDRRIDNRVQEISMITRQLKMLAGEFDCPVLLASQLNRASVQYGQPPTLTALRESGSIEQDADVVVLLHTDGEEPDVHGGLDLDAIVAKNRQGALGTATLHRHGPTATIEDADREPINQRKGQAA